MFNILGQLVHSRVLQQHHQPGHDHPCLLWSGPDSSSSVGDKICPQLPDVAGGWCWFHSLSHDTSVSLLNSLIQFSSFKTILDTGPSCLMSCPWFTVVAPSSTVSTW